MTPTNFEEANIIMGEGKPNPVPMFFDRNNSSAVICLKLTKAELKEVRSTGRVWLQTQVTGFVQGAGGFLPPFNITTKKPLREMTPEEQERVKATAELQRIAKLEAEKAMTRQQRRRHEREEDKDKEEIEKHLTVIK
jgi:hypothetical protein